MALYWIPIYIGISSGVIALLSVIVTFQTPVKLNKFKAYWITAFMFFAITGILALFWQQSLLSTKENDKALVDAGIERRHQNQEIKLNQDIAFLKGQSTATITLLSSKGNNDDIATQLSSSFEKFSNKLGQSSKSSEKETISKSKIPLKQRALSLSQEILAFISNRDKLEPKSSYQPISEEEFSRYMQKSLEYSTETINLYSVNFSSDVMEIHDEFARIGIIDKDFEVLYRNPNNRIIISLVGTTIGALAKRLP